MLPLGLLNSSRKSAILVEVKSGETFNGTLDNCDVLMNLHLLDVIKTSSDGDRFWKLPETFIRGNSIKYIRLPEEILENAKNINRRQQQQRRRGIGSQRGTYRGRSRNNSDHDNNRRHTAIFTWHWNVENENVCGICQNQFEATCPTCTIPGDGCPLMWGSCKHTFHMHCIVKWLQQQVDQGNPHCPMCRQPWEELVDT